MSQNDEEDDQIDDPGVPLKRQDGLDTEERDNKTGNCNDNNAESSADFAIGDSIKSDTTGDATGRTPTNLSDGVQERDELGRIPTETVSADRNLTQTSRGAQSGAKA